MQFVSFTVTKDKKLLHFVLRKLSIIRWKSGSHYRGDILMGENSLLSHFKTHGKEFNCTSERDYLSLARIKAIDITSRSFFGDENCCTEFVISSGKLINAKIKNDDTVIIIRQGKFVTMFTPDYI